MFCPSALVQPTVQSAPKGDGAFDIFSSAARCQDCRIVLPDWPRNVFPVLVTRGEQVEAAGGISFRYRRISPLNQPTLQSGNTGSYAEILLVKSQSEKVY